MLAALILLLAAFAAEVGVLPRPAYAGDDWYSELARHWAPCIFQDVAISSANPEGRYDFITRVDFDGDMRGGNNWENAAYSRRMDFSLRPYVYYSVTETRTHYYLTYSLFHPRDWQWYLAGGTAPPGAMMPVTHENDLESAVLVILKHGRYGKLRLMSTVCHLQNYCFVADPGIRPKAWAWDLSSGELQVSFFENRPCLFVEAGGHGIGGLRRAMKQDESGAYTIGSRKYRFGSGVGILYRCSDDPDYVPDTEPLVSFVESAQDAFSDYQLIPLLDSLWPLRHDVSGQAMFEETFDYEIAPDCHLEDLPLLLAADQQDPGANPPWARDALSDGLARGDWFLRPAMAMDQYLDEWPDRDMPGYSQYIRNPYMAGDNVIAVVSPQDDRTWNAGYPLRIEWQIRPAGPPISDIARVYLSMTGGRTWRLVSMSANTNGGHYVWNVTGPPSDECVAAVRAGLQCDPGVDVVGYSPLFSISEPETLTWSVINDYPRDGLARSHTQAAYDPLGDRIVLFGGRSPDLHNDTWAFGFQSMAWRRIHDGVTGAPQERYSHAGIYDTARRRLIIHGGCGNNYFDDTWIFDLETGKWHRLDTVGQDPRSGSVGIFDPVDDRLVVFGGTDAHFAKNDVRAIRLPAESLENLSWETLHSGGAPAPLARVDGAGVYDAARRQLIVHGGLGGPMGNVPLSDTWAFSLGASEWVRLHDGAGDCPPARWGHVAVVDGESGALIIFGGTDLTTDYGDVWLFDPLRREWTEISDGTAGQAPAPRSGAMGVIRDRGGQLVIAGGRGRAGSPDDVWSFLLRKHNWPRQEQVRGGEETLRPDSFIWPNPSSGEVSIGLDLPTKGQVTVAVYDVRGRLLRTIHDSKMGAGFHIFRWDGRDSGGVGIGSGVYFCTISMEGRSYERPIVMLR